MISSTNLSKIFKKGYTIRGTRYANYTLHLAPCTIYRILCTICVIIFSCVLQAQEFNVRVTVNSSRIEGSNKDVFTSLQTQLNDFLNTQRWTAATFSPTEKIECSFAIEIPPFTITRLFKKRV